MNNPYPPDARPVDIDHVVGSNIRQTRKRRGWSHAQLVEELDRYLGKHWTSDRLERAENGEHAFTAVELVGLAATLEVPMAKLFAGSDSVILPNGMALSTGDCATVFPSSDTAALCDRLQALDRTVSDLSGLLATAQGHVRGAKHHVRGMAERLEG